MGTEYSGINDTTNRESNDDLFTEADDLLLDEIETPFDEFEPTTPPNPQTNVVLFRDDNVGIEETSKFHGPQDLDTLLQTSLQDLDEEEEEEVRELQSLTQYLKDRDYVSVDSLDYEELTSLIQRDKEILRLEENNVIADMLVQSIDTACSAFENSVGSFYKIDATHVDVQLKDIQRGNTINDVTANLLLKLVSFTDVDPTLSLDESVNFILSLALKGGIIDNQQLETDGATLSDYVGTLIPAINASKSRLESTRNAINEQRRFTAGVLLKDIEDMKRLYKSEEFQCIKQLYLRGSSYYYKCPVCGQMHEIPKHFLTVLIFPNESTHSFTAEKASNKIRISGNYFIFVIPRPLACDCGAHMAFCVTDILALKYFVFDYVKNRIRDVATSIENFGKGTSLLTLWLPPSILENALANIVVREVDKENSSSKVIEEDSIGGELRDASDDWLLSMGIADYDFKQAVDRFYTNLSGLTEVTLQPAESTKDLVHENNESTMVAEEPGEVYRGNGSNSQRASGDNSLSYKEVALYVATSLSKKYESVKNQALFTLIANVEENPALSILCDKEELWFWENQISLLDSLDSKAKIVRPEFMQPIYDSYNSLKPNEVSMDDFYEDASVRDRVLDYLLNNRQVILDRISYLKDCHKNALDYLRKNLDLLGYTKIMNINQYSYKNFSCVVDSTELYSLLDEISDRMIIFNYSPEFYKLYRSKGILNKRSSFDKQLSINRAEKLGSSTFFKHLLGSIADLSHFTITDEQSQKLEDRFRIMLQMSTLPLKGLHELKQHFSSCQLYEFLQTALKLQATTLLVSKDADDVYWEFRDAVRKFADSIHFSDYLDKENGREIFYFTDFSEEEIQSCEELKQLKIKRFIPKRLPNETPYDYCTRYKKYMNESLCNTLNSYDLLERFKSLTPYFIFVMNCSNVYELGYFSFNESIFCNTLIQSCVEILDKDTALNVLGIPTTMMNLLLKNTRFIDVSLLKPEVQEFNNKMLMASYSDNLMTFMQRERATYDSISLPADGDLNQHVCPYDFLKVISEILNNIATLNLEESEDPLDEEDVRNELYTYASYYQEFSQRY